MGKVYSKKFRMKMVNRMIGPDGISASKLSEEVGVSQTALSRWLRKSSITGDMKNEEPMDSENKVAKNTGQRSVMDRLRIVVEAEGLSGTEMGVFLRREGIHEAQLEQWQKVLQGAFKPSKASSKDTEQKRRIRELESELRRKDKALAETAALLVLAKKYQAPWEEGANDMNQKSGKR